VVQNLLHHPWYKRGATKSICYGESNMKYIS
jgi:hypothetical protein